MQEIWKDVPNYEGIYQVSNLGNVKSLKFGKEKTLKKRSDKDGYLLFNLSKNGICKTNKAHKLVAIAFLNHKQCGYKVIVDHINNIKTDNRVENLQLITVRQNCSKDRKNKTSKYTGVIYYKNTNKWRAQISINGKLKYLGDFKNEYDAHLAYQNKLKEISNL
jgi:hypothetical protein